MTRPDVSLVIPDYNSARYLNDNVLRVRDFYARAGIDGEIVVADDGSVDGTPESVTESDRIRVLRLPYLLLKYRLDVKRIPVRLERNEPSSVRVVRDSVAAFSGIAAIRWRWATGRYRAPLLLDLLQNELRRDVEEAARRLSPTTPSVDTPD